jgi:hypothetical protein
VNAKNFLESIRNLKNLMILSKNEYDIFFAKCNELLTKEKHELLNIKRENAELLREKNIYDNILRTRPPRQLTCGDSGV